MYAVKVCGQFSAAHFLRNYHGSDEPLHGHNWKVEVVYRGKSLIEPEEYLIDFVEVESALQNILGKIDYKLLNETPPFDMRNPSAENVACWIFQELAKQIQLLPPYSVTVWETERGAATYQAD